MRYFVALLTLVSIFAVACHNEPMIITDIIHIDTSGNGGGGGGDCGTAVGLYTSSVTASSATLNWSAVTGAAGYNVQYKIVGSATWASGTSTINSFPVSGLTASTNYEFQVQTVCSGDSSDFTASAIFWTASGEDTTGIPCDPDTAYFQNDILPIFISNCAKPGCHDAQTHEEGLILDSYENIMASGDIDPGDPGNSKIFEVLVDNEPDDRMPPPPNAPLTSDQIALIYKWILQGALNNYCGGGECDTLSTTFSGTVFPIIQTNCIGCHSGPVISGGVDLSDYNNIYTHVVNGSLYGSVNQLPGYTAMPLGSRLSDCDINKINFWINDGAPNN